MLIYLATYPRSGAALLRETIALNWGIATANLYEMVDWPERLRVRATRCPVFQTYGAEDKRRTMLKSPVGPLLTEDVRRRLSSEPECYLIKTHERPPRTAFEGESAIQMVRHPGAAMVSYWRLQQRLKGQALPFARFVAGIETGGRWADYHAAWLDAPMPVARMRYEDQLARPYSLLPVLAGGLKLPVPDLPRLVGIADAHARNPVRNPGRGAGGWKAELTPFKVNRLWEIHGRVAERFGYDINGTANLSSFPERPVVQALQQ